MHFKLAENPLKQLLEKHPKVISTHVKPDFSSHAPELLTALKKYALTNKLQSLHQPITVASGATAMHLNRIQETLLEHGFKPTSTISSRTEKAKPTMHVWTHEDGTQYVAHVESVKTGTQITFGGLPSWKGTARLLDAHRAVMARFGGPFQSDVPRTVKSVGMERRSYKL